MLLGFATELVLPQRFLKSRSSRLQETFPSFWPLGSSDQGSASGYVHQAPKPQAVAPGCPSWGAEGLLAPQASGFCSPGFFPVKGRSKGSLALVFWQTSLTKGGAPRQPCLEVGLVTHIIAVYVLVAPNRGCNQGSRCMFFLYNQAS